ncbi:hypothetical protein ACFU99_34150 [Streptomyces sp. NPDC057654]|uniref:hypothetical protein n=1 Tax=Streptomyces sp. NPDC057654 TaxID=3346196 RepID=UPI0036899E5C
MPSTTIRVTVTDPDTAIPLAKVTVTADKPVAEQCRRYFDRRWHVDPAPRPTATGPVPVISATVDPHEAQAIRQLVIDHEHERGLYGQDLALRMRDDDGRAYAVQPDRVVAYRADPDRRRLDIFVPRRNMIGPAAVHLARDVIRAQLQADGWALLRGAAVVRDGKALLIAGAAGAGTTTAVLHLCRAGWQVISDGQVFARPAPGGVHLLPYPAPLATSLLLADSVGLYDHVQEHFLADVPPAGPPQPDAIACALRLGSRAAPVDELGMVQQALSHPAQLKLTPAAGGTAAAVLLPHVLPGLTEPTTDPHAELDDDLFTEVDHYPDLLGLTADTEPQADPVQAVREALAPLPRWSVRLGHDPRETAAFLNTAADNLVFGHSVAAGPAR